jgi:DNA-binding HxlR family transcriptional regulator
LILESEAYQLYFLKVSTHKKVSIMSDENKGILAAVIQRGEVLSKECPSREILKHVTSQWGVLVLIVLLNGTHRFSQLRRKIGGVSEKMLTQTLQQLEMDGFVLRVSYPVVPPHTEYSLTPLGEGIGRQVESLTDWIEENIGQILQGQKHSTK